MTNPLYRQAFKSIKKLVAAYCRLVIHFVPQTRIELYWEVGKIIVNSDLKWDKALFQKLAKDLDKRFPNTEGISASNLANMHRFYENYRYLEDKPAKRDSLLQTLEKYQLIDAKKLLLKIRWSRHRMLLRKSFYEREFYLFMCDKLELSADGLKESYRRQWRTRYLECSDLSPSGRDEIAAIFARAGLSSKANLEAFQLFLTYYIRCYDWWENPLTGSFEQKFQRWQKHGIWSQICEVFERELLKVDRSPVHNRGLFTQRDIPEGVKVIEYRGERMDAAELKRREQIDSQVRVYLFHIGDELYIDGTKGNIAKYINHSCDPNCFAKYINGSMWLISLRDIDKGEELSFNYGYRFEGFRNRPCRCGTEYCIGYIVSERWRGKVQEELHQD